MFFKYDTRRFLFLERTHAVSGGTGLSAEPSPSLHENLPASQPATNFPTCPKKHSFSKKTGLLLGHPVPTRGIFRRAKGHFHRRDRQKKSEIPRSSGSGPPFRSLNHGSGLQSLICFHSFRFQFWVALFQFAFLNSNLNPSEILFPLTNHCPPGKFVPSCPPPSRQKGGNGGSAVYFSPSRKGVSSFHSSPKKGIKTEFIISKVWGMGRIKGRKREKRRQFKPIWE